MTVYIVVEDNPDEVLTFRDVIAIDKDGDTIKITMAFYETVRLTAWKVIKRVLSLESN